METFTRQPGLILDLITENRCIVVDIFVSRSREILQKIKILLTTPQKRGETTTPTRPTVVTGPLPRYYVNLLISAVPPPPPSGLLAVLPPDL